MNTLSTFWDKMIADRTESLHFFVFMNSPAKRANGGLVRI